MRLNKFIASTGHTSRRGADVLISENKVKLNGQVVTDFSTQIDPSKDKVEIAGKVITVEEEKVVYLLNKPRGVVTTATDPQGRQTVLDFVPKTPRVFPCGRLDEDTMGLVILTNDGNLCYQLTHPKFEHQKEYRVTGHGPRIETSWEKLQQKIVLKDGPVKIDHLRLHKINKEKIDFTITVHEGRNRLVRRICSHVGIEVDKLTRIRVAHYTLEGIEPGRFKQLV